MYYIVSNDVFEGLPDEAKTAIKADSPYVSDEKDAARIENIAGIENEADLGDKMKFGAEDEYEADTDSKGNLKMGDSEKNAIKDFGMASKMGMAFVNKKHEGEGMMDEKKDMTEDGKKPSKIKKIKENKDVEEEQ
jgi:hypothetical protein